MDSSENDMSRENYPSDTEESVLYNNVVDRINRIPEELLNSTWENVLLQLNDSQRKEIADVESESGIRCLLKIWFNIGNTSFPNPHHKYCNISWDGVYCWPASPSGSHILKHCSEIFEDFYSHSNNYLKGDVSRNCSENGTWDAWNKTNYEICTSTEILERGFSKNQMSMFVRYMVFVGSILSLFCLSIALTIFCSYKQLRTQRFTVNIHLMVALLFRFILLYVITEPVVFNRHTTYRDYDLLCKTVILAYLYSTAASVMWMLVQGIHLNSILTTNVLTGESKWKFRFYYVLGWVFPALITSIYLGIMIVNQHEEKCWRGYSDMMEIWIFLIPIIVALAMNGLFLLNILRIVTRKSECQNTRPDRSNFLSIAKATLVLFPVLGTNNLLLVYNPGGFFEKYFVSLNTFFGSTQGIFVAVVYCFMNKDVQQNIRHSFNRFRVQRSMRGNAGESQRKRFAMVNMPNNSAHQNEEQSV